MTETLAPSAVRLTKKRCSKLVKGTTKFKNTHRGVEKIVHRTKRHVLIGSLSIQLGVPIEWINDVVEEMIVTGTVRDLTSKEKLNQGLSPEALAIILVGEAKIGLAYD